MSHQLQKVGRLRQHVCALCGSLLVCLPAAHVCAEESDVPDSDVAPVFQADYGGVGLLETPTARMAPVGTFSFTYTEVDPY
uniref:YjbH domain-containing protein n=1 Tax=uncultured Salinisphaera sp. TaxID=359372 RepID=UPI0032B30CEA